MLKKLITRLLEPRHYWRTAGFNELSELYTVQLLRSLSISMVSIFVPIYLFKIGYSITSIAGFFLLWFAIRPLFTYMTARLIAWIGPKHSMVFSISLQIAYLGFILSLETMHWPLWVIALIGSFYFGLYRMAFDVDFSKVKHTEHGGKEVGYLQIFERTGAVLGPIVGGLIAGIFDPRYTLALAIVIISLTLIPLLATSEPVRRRQVIVVKGFPFKRYRWDIFISSAFQFQEVASVIIWPLFLGIFVFTNNTYQLLGVLASVGTVLAMLSAYAIGKIVDNNKGRQLLNLGATINAGILLIKPFITTTIGAFFINIVREPVSVMYKIPFMKGRYDEADSVPGYRIVYFMYIELAIAFANIVIWGSVVIISLTVDGKVALQAAFVAGAVMSLLLTKQKFAALR